MKCSKDEIREIFYENGVNVEYISSYTKKEGEKKTVINIKCYTETLLRQKSDK